MQLWSPSNYMESFHYFNFKISVMVGIRPWALDAGILKYISTRSGCNTASCCTVIFVSYRECRIDLTFRLHLSDEMLCCSDVCCLLLFSLFISALLHLYLMVLIQEMFLHFGIRCFFHIFVVFILSSLLCPLSPFPLHGICITSLPRSSLCIRSTVSILYLLVLPC
jgi:hypothetical protein